VGGNQGGLKPVFWKKGQKGSKKHCFLRYFWDLGGIGGVFQ